MKVEPLDITDIWILRSGLVMSLGLDIQLSLTTGISIVDISLAFL